MRVLDLLSQAGIQIIASSVADTQDYGIYRVLCDDPQKAYDILRESAINVQLSDVIAISIDDSPGSAARAVKALSDAGVGIRYLYSFLWKGRGVLAFRADSGDRACEVISTAGITCLTSF